MSRGQLGTMLRHIRGSVADRDAAALSDRQLLDRFVHDRDEAAFTALMRRHGPLVLAACRRVLHHQQDAEDACQAAFLVLARKAHSIRKREAVAAWLYGVALRIASNLKRQLERRRLRETLAVEVAQSDSGDVSWREVQAVLDEELAALPERYRAPLLLCCLEGRTRDEAAEVLGWTVGQVKGRLERARTLLRKRLECRGVSVGAAFLTALLAEGITPAPVPTALVVATVQVAVGSAAAVTVPAQVVSLTEGVMHAMWLAKLRAVVASLLVLSVLGGAAGVLISGAAQLQEKGPQAVDQPAPGQEVQKLVQGLSGTDVAWSGQWIGIMAHLKSDRARRLVAIGEPAIPDLIKALADEKRYASAHAILTKISKVEHAFVPYNGLHVTFTDDGKTVFFPEDRPVLARRWQQWYAARPRPKTLPEDPAVPRTGKEAIAAFQSQARATAAKVTPASRRRLLEDRIAATDMLTARRIRCAAALARITDTLTEAEAKTLIVHGATADLRRDGECWAIESFGTDGSEVAGYLDVTTGRLVLLWIIPEG